VIDKVLGRYRVASTGSLTQASQRNVRRLAIEHADEFLERFPRHRQDFMVWALCCALVDAKNQRATAVDFLRLAWRSLSPVSWKELQSNLGRMRETQVRWRQRRRLTVASR
jgi:hypothetical protein